MWTVFLVCLIVITSMVGVTELLRSLWLYLMRPKEDPSRVMLVFLKEGIAVQQLRSAMEYITWEGQKSFCRIAAIDCGLSEDSRNAVIKIIARSPYMIFGTNALLEYVEDTYFNKKDKL